MPLYEYACTDCLHQFEILQRMGQGAEDLVCPQCHGKGLEKQFSTFACASDGNSSPSPAACGTGTGFT